MTPDGEWSLRRLVQSRRAYNVSILVLLLVFVVLLVVDAGTYSPSERLGTSLINVGYGVLSSLLASVLVARVVVAQQWQSRKRKMASEILTIFGVDLWNPDQTVALVLPSFKFEPTGAERDTKIAALFDSRVGRFAFSNGDVDAALEISRLLSDADLRSPVVLSDVEFLATAQETHPFSVTSAARGTVTKVDVVIAIGLWSNDVTRRVAETPWSPVRIGGEGRERWMSLLVGDPTLGDHVLSPIPKAQYCLLQRGEGID